MIDVGQVDAENGYGYGGGNAYLAWDSYNPSNGSGKLTTCKARKYNSSADNFKFVTVYKNDENKYGARDYVDVGTLRYGAIRTFAGLNLKVEMGDCLGWSCTSNSSLSRTTKTGTSMFSITNTGWVTGTFYSATPSVTNYAWMVYGEGETATVGIIPQILVCM